MYFIKFFYFTTIWHINICAVHLTKLNAQFRRKNPFKY